MSKHCFIFLALSACAFLALAMAEAGVADKEFITKQKIVYNMFMNSNQPNIPTDLYDLGKSYNIEEHLESYNHPEFVREFIAMYKHDMLPRGEIFSIFYPEHEHQAVALFKVFYHSKDFDTFHKTAAWARIHVNEGLFLYAFSVAVMHYPETQKMRIPPQSEFYPDLYHNSEVIRKAWFAKTGNGPTVSSIDNVIIVNGSYSDCSWGEENPLSYYTEDIGVSNTQHYAHIAHPFWMPTKEYNLTSDIRGLAYLANLKWASARFFMERLCNGMGEVKDFDWNQRMPYGYLPSWSYHNGISPRSRESDSLIPNYKYKELTEVQNLEARIRWAIATGTVLLPNGTSLPFINEEGFNFLGNLIEGNMDSPNLEIYGSYDRSSRNVLGFSPKPQNKHKVIPSVLQHYGTAHKDAMYWSLSKKILDFYYLFAEKLPKYTVEEVGFPGVEIEDVEIDRVTTFLTPYDALITEAVPRVNGEDKTVIKARQYRLDHKPFGIRVNIKSKEDVDACMQFFLGPKYNKNGQEIDIVENWKYFIPTDEWIVHLKAGTNTIHRNSTQSLMGTLEKPTGDVFYKQIERAISGDETYEIPKLPYGFPGRMLIPKGSPGGYPYQFLVFASPCDGKDLYHSRSRVMGEKTLASKLIGKPLDRPPFHNFTHLPNAYFKEFNIYHIEESDINATI